jgi:hypothetical protein
MAKKIITLTFDDEGNPSIDLAGYKGKGCQAVQDVFGRVLGTTKSVTTKPEYAMPVMDKLKARN